MLHVRVFKSGLAWMAVEFEPNVGLAKLYICDKALAVQRHEVQDLNNRAP